jgi:hypothetical protein
VTEFGPSSAPGNRVFNPGVGGTLSVVAARASWDAWLIVQFVRDVAATDDEHAVSTLGACRALMSEW